MSLNARIDSIDLVGPEARGRGPQPHAPKGTITIDPLVWPVNRIMREKAMQIDYRFWLAADAVDKTVAVQLWGYPDEGDMLPSDRGVAPSKLQSETPLWMCHVNANAATTVFANDLTVALGRSGANIRRVFIAYRCKGQRTKFDLGLGVSTFLAVDAGSRLVVFPVVAQLNLLDGTDISYTNADQSAGTAWTAAGSGTTGTGTATGHNAGTRRAEVDYPAAGGKAIYSDEPSADGVTRVNPALGSILDVVNEAEEAARIAGLDYFVLGIANMDESDSTNNVMTFATENYTLDTSLVPSQSGELVTRYTGVGDKLAALTLKFGGKLCAKKHPISGKPDTRNWYQASYVSADTFRINTDAVKFLRNVDDGNVLVVRTERLIYGSFRWQAMAALPSGATMFEPEAFLIQ